MRTASVIEFGRVRLKALETPGHTPESISILVYDLERSATEPHAVLTGDTLFIGDVGRPDLRGSLGWSANDLGALLYDSLQSKLLPLPDASLVYPAHGAGSLCGKAISKETVSTIGDQRRLNYALQPMTKKAFIDLVTADQPEAPPYFVYDAVLNSKERLDTRRSARARAEAAIARRGAGIASRWRADSRYARPRRIWRRAPRRQHQHRPRRPIRHLGRHRCSTMTIPIVIIAAPGRESESAVRLGRIGFDHVAGYLQNGLQSLESRPDLIAFVERLSPQFVAELLASSEPPLVIDVRAPREREQKQISGSVSSPLNHLLENLSALPKNRALLVYCAGGYRSSIAASLLKSSGFDSVGEIAGGIAAWESANLPVQSAQA